MRLLTDLPSVDEIFDSVILSASIFLAEASAMVPMMGIAKLDAAMDIPSIDEIVDGLFLSASIYLEEASAIIGISEHFAERIRRKLT